MSSPRAGQPWKEERLLGSGSFGLVRLFTNERTGSKIALKEMKQDVLRSMSPADRKKMITRLENEIKIMWEHNHDNLIKACNAPENMYYKPPPDVLHVWMEYCDGGDLRNNVLQLPENCCGVQEKQFREICRDINSGIRFLHSQHIIHRDLKPENILITHVNNKTIYKLTDLGYAKSFNLSTRADSVVGTPQYVAPEVINEDEHGLPVDFWSFGIIAFELATCIRPFLHKVTRNPFDWIGPTCYKADNTIYIEFDESRSPCESDQMPLPYQISSVFAEKLTKWLHLALQTKPERRGGVDRSSTEEAPCLLRMEELLDTKVLNIVCMSKGDSMSIEIKDDTKVSLVYSWLQRQGYSPEHQYLLTEQGNILTFQGDSEKILLPLLQMDTNMSTVYLFSDDQDPSFKLVGQVMPTVRNLIAVGDKGLHKDDQHLHFCHAYSHIREQEKLFERLHRGHKSFLCIIDQLCSRLKDNFNETVLPLLCNCNRVLGAARLAKQMHKRDIERLKCHDITSELLEQWNQSTVQLDKHIEELEKILNIQKDIETSLTKAEVVKQCHLSGENRLDSFHKECVKKALTIIRNEKSGSDHDNMADLLPVASQMAENLIQDHLNKINYLQVHMTLSGVHKSIESFNEKVAELEKKCFEISETIQNGIWESLVLPSSRSRGARNGNVDVSQSLTHPVSISRSDSVSSCKEILVRLRSQTSISSESTDNDGDDIQSLMGSLKTEINNMKEMSAKEIKRNESILMRARETGANFYIEEDDPISQEHELID